ncbi:MAG: hypothetical protein WB562_20445 [Candidatus Sulfotelmatobacter sp.]
MSAYAGVNGDVWLSTSPPTALGSPESCTDTGDHIHYFSNVHQAWDPTQTLTVQNSPNGSTGWATVTDYVFYWPVGEIVFNSARVPGTNNFVRINAGSYFTLSALSGAHAWKGQFKGAVKDVTPFQASGSWTQNLATLKSLTFSVDCFNQDARILNEMISSGMSQINISGGIILCQLWWNEAGGARYQFYALPTQVQQTVATNDVDKQSVTFAATGPVYQVTSNTFSTTTVILM